MNPEYLTKAKSAAKGALTLRPDHRALALAWAVAAFSGLAGGSVALIGAAALAGLSLHIGYLRGVPLRAGSAAGK